MFQDEIIFTPYTTTSMIKHFSDIRCQNLKWDKSFYSTLCALVGPRKKKEDQICLTVAETLRISDIEGNSLQKNRIWIYDVPSNTDCGISSRFNPGRGYCFLEKVTMFFIKSFKVFCYINYDLHSVIIYVENLDLKKWHYLQSAIVVFLPWYFVPKTGITQDEMDLVRSLTEKSSDKYLRCLDKLAEQQNLREKIINEELNDIEKIQNQRLIQSTEESITNISNSLKSMLIQMNALLKAKHREETMLIGLKIENENKKSEIKEYFLRNKKLHFIETHDSKIEFVVKDYMTYFDEDLAKRIIDNPRSYIYRFSLSSIDKENMKKLMYAIFIEQTLRLKVCAAYELDIPSGFSALDNYDYKCGYEFKDCIPNPHIDKFACLGGYEAKIYECMLNNNFINAIEQCVASCKSINFGDSIVIEHFSMELAEGRNKCIELPDGNMVTSYEAIKWLTEQEAKVEDE